MMGDTRWSTRQVILATLVVLAVGIAVYLLYRFLNVLLILFVAALISVIARPLVHWLQRRGAPTFVSSVMVHVVLVLLLLTILAFIAPVMFQQAADAADSLPRFYGQTREALTDSPSIVLRRVGATLPSRPSVEPNGEMGAASEAEGEIEAALDRVSTFLSYGSRFLEGLVVTLFVLILSIFWTTESARLTRSASMLLPTSQREEAREVAGEIGKRLGDFVRGQGILMAAVGLLALGAYLVMGLPYALLLALFAGLMEAVPLIGPTLGAIPAALVAATISWPTVLWVAVSTMAIQLLENNLLVPRVMNESVGVRPLLALLALAIFGTLMGIPGALLAIPLAAIAQVLFTTLVLDRQREETPGVDGRDRVSALRYRVQELARDARRQAAAEGEDEERGTLEAEEEVDSAKDEIESMAVELDEILVEALAVDPQ